MLLRKTLVNDDCLLSFASWHGNAFMFMHMRDATVSLKTRSLVLIAAYLRIVAIMAIYHCVSIEV